MTLHTYEKSVVVVEVRVVTDSTPALSLLCVCDASPKIFPSRDRNMITAII